MVWVTQRPSPPPSLTIDSIYHNLKKGRQIDSVKVIFLSFFCLCSPVSNMESTRPEISNWFHVAPRGGEGVGGSSLIFHPYGRLSLSARGWSVCVLLVLDR